MLEPRGEPNLPLEALVTHRRSQLGTEDLERHWPVVLHIPREMHRRHPASAKLALDQVLAFQGVLQRLSRVGHGGSPIRVSKRLKRGSDRTGSSSGSVSRNHVRTGSRASAARSSHVNAWVLSSSPTYATARP